MTLLGIERGRWRIDGAVTYAGAPAEGLLLNVRMANALFEDRAKAKAFSRVDARRVATVTKRFIAAVPAYAAAGVRAFTVGLQGGHPGYEGARNTAFEADGRRRQAYFTRAKKLIAACDRAGCAVILSCLYQRQSKFLRNFAAVRRAVEETAAWIRGEGFTNVALEVANEFAHHGYVHREMRQVEGQLELIQAAQRRAPKLLISTSGMGSGQYPAELAAAVDFLLIHFNTIRRSEIPARVRALKRYCKPIVCNEDVAEGVAGARALTQCVRLGVSWGLMLAVHNQRAPFAFDGTADDPAVYAAFEKASRRAQKRSR